ncbi:MAG: HNH endonuclease [Actinobacteria bacterium]|nr:MAG: HNH endonuclease [Actinomycetota bacterium]
MRGRPRRQTEKMLAAQRLRGLSNRGPANHFWIDGRTKETRVRSNRWQWREIADKIRRRDNFTCQRCRAIGRIMIVHHIEEWNGSNDQDDNLTTLCRSCHAVIHKSKKGSPCHLGFLKTA